jgi:replication factor A1
MTNLTKGSIKRILDGEDVIYPILEITSFKNIHNKKNENNNHIDNYKVSLFDGIFEHSLCILDAVNQKIDSIEIGTVIRLDDFTTNVFSKDSVNPPKIGIIVFAFTIIGEKETTNYSKKTTEYNITNESEDQSINPSQIKFNMDDCDRFKLKPKYFNDEKVTPIADLDPFRTRWAILARVTHKSPIRTYNNSNSNGKLFNITFVDNTGEISAIGFNEQCDNFYDNIEPNHVYYVFGGNFKVSNKKFSKVNNDYELVFTKNTIIELCDNQMDADKIIAKPYTLCPLDQIANKQDNDLVDVIGIVNFVGQLNNIQIKSTGKNVFLRDIQIADSNNFCIKATLWDKQAEEFILKNENTVILVKGARVREYNGHNLNFGNADIQFNPDIPEAIQLRNLYLKKMQDTH